MSIINSTSLTSNPLTLSFLFLFCLVTVVPQDYAKENLTQNNIIEDDVGNSNDEFLKYKLARPVIYSKHHGREITKEIDKLLTYPDDLIIFISTDEEALVLDLTLNKPLISKDYFSRTQKDGIHIITKPIRKKAKFCHYRGKVRNKVHSWVALSICGGLSGIIYDGTNIHYIEKQDTESNEHVVLYKHEDLVVRNGTCGFKESDFISQSQHFRPRREVPQEKNLTREPYNSNSESRFIELLLVVDNRKYVEMNSSVENAEEYCKSVANIMNGIYSPLNIFIALTGVVVWTEQDEITFSTDGDTTLANFLNYRRRKLIRQHPNDNAQLITKQTFNNGVIGKALKKPICTARYSGGVSNDYSSIIGITATTVAHMLGHNLGMEHDTEKCDCPDAACIMTARSSASPTHWSSCSREAVTHAFAHGMDHCLKNLPKSMYAGAVCGNGFVEDGEECDCGLPEFCANKCCNAITCKLEADAKCATGKCCDLKNCTLTRPGTSCRKASSDCDLPEYCTGKTEFCPADVFKLDAEICDDGKGHCYQGRCGSRLQQCKLLWGPTGTPADNFCHTLNLKGTRFGNCGYDLVNETYEKCDQQNIMCGTLHCKHLSETLQYGLESVTILSHSYLNSKGVIHACGSANVDLGVDSSDPGMVPNGAPCGTGNMCLNQKCVSIASVQEGLSCPHNCYNNGYCNNLGHCHCYADFLLPDCQFFSLGGSVDSGPAYA